MIWAYWGDPNGYTDAELDLARQIRKIANEEHKVAGIKLFKTSTGKRFPCVEPGTPLISTKTGGHNDSWWYKILPRWYLLFTRGRTCSKQSTINAWFSQKNEIDVKIQYSVLQAIPTCTRD